jgi:hypothetical protein
MPSPRDYLSNPREADLAERVWRLTPSLSPSGYSMVGIHEFFASIPWTNRRIILARDWITKFREMDGDGGVRTVNQQLGGTDFTAGEIGNVEHFYVAAFMGTIMPNNPIWFGIMSSASLFWEAVVGPSRIAWAKRELPANKLMEFVARNFAHNVDQFSNADVAGLRFGEFCSLGEAVEYLQHEFGTPPTPPPAPPATPGGPLPTVTVGAGDSLSLIAQRRYNDMLLWPVIYDANLAVVGPNPNKTKVGQVLVIPSIAGMTAAQRDAYHVRGRAWRSYN